MIACVLVPHFAAAVERREEPSLAAAPLIIGESPGDSGKVFAVSSEAARVGVEPGISLRQARVLCPQARFIPMAHARYQRAFDELLEVLGGFTPRVEPGDLQPAATCYLDLGPQEQSQAVETVRCLGQTVREEVRLAPAIGLAGGKFPAYVAAASVEPNKALIVQSGREATFLAPLPVDLLPLNGETARWLRLLGIRTLGQLAALPAGPILTQLGVQGRLLHQLARGCDERPILPRRPQVMEKVSRRFDGPVANQAVLESIAQAMAVELAERLQARGLIGRELRLILHLEDETNHEERLVMRRPTDDSGRLTHILSELITQVQFCCAVAGLEVILTGLVPATGEQLDLFIHRTGQGNRLREALKNLVARYGADCFYQVSLLNRAISLPERRFRLREVDTP